MNFRHHQLLGIKSNISKSTKSYLRIRFLFRSIEFLFVEFLFLSLFFCFFSVHVFIFSSLNSQVLWKMKNKLLICELFSYRFCSSYMCVCAAQSIYFVVMFCFFSLVRFGLSLAHFSFACKTFMLSCVRYCRSLFVCCLFFSEYDNIKMLD